MNSSQKPRNRLPVVATQVSTTIRMGPTQGAAIRPIAAPISNGPRNPVRPPPTRLVRELGSWMSNRPAMLRPIAPMTANTMPAKTGVCVAWPNAPPVAAARTPSSE